MQPMIEREQSPPNITGLSLVMFLFLSVMSMMAAYQVGKPHDDIRHTAIVNYHEYTSPGAESEFSSDTLFVEETRVSAPVFAPFVIAFQFPPIPSAFSPQGFNARAPPAQTAHAS